MKNIITVDYIQLVKPFDLKISEEITKTSVVFMKELTELAVKNGTSEGMTTKNIDKMAEVEV